MWWNWNNGFVNGMPWMEFFVKRMAEESRAFGRPLIDLVDFHTYIGGSASDEGRAAGAPHLLRPRLPVPAREWRQEVPGRQVA